MKNETIIELSEPEAKALAEIQTQIGGYFTRIGELFCVAMIEAVGAASQAIGRRNQIVADKVALNGANKSKGVEVDIHGKRLIVGGS